MVSINHPLLASFEAESRHLRNLCPPYLLNNQTRVDAAHLWETGNGEWALRTFMDLVESGDVRRLFSDAELLELVQAEEEYQRRMATNTRRTSPKGISNATPRGAARPMTGGGPANAWEETPALGGSPEAEHTSSKGEV